MTEKNWWQYDVPEPIGVRGLPRKDGLEKATGKAIYVSDVSVPGMLYAKMLTSPYAHGKIKSMNIDKAKALPGVWDIMKWDDPDVKDEWQMNTPDSDETILALPGISDFYSHNMGVAVVADSVEICDRALRLIEIEWEELGFVLDQEEAMKPGAPQVYTEVMPFLEEGNMHMDKEMAWGDIEQGFAEAEQIIEFRIDREENTANAEPYKAVARWNGEHLEVWARGQCPYHVQYSLAGVAGSAANVDLNIPYNGATFGGITWLSITPIMPRIAAILAKRIGRPVRLDYDESNFYCCGDEYGVQKFRIGFKNDGTITAVDTESIGMRTNLGKTKEGTIIPNGRCRHKYVWVNRPHRMCYRHGAVDCIAINEITARVAAALGKDPIEVIRKNDGCDGHDWDHLLEFQRENGFPVVNSFEDALAVGKAAIGWDEKYHAPGTKKLPNGKMHGIGLTWNHQWTNIGMLKDNMALTLRNGKACIIGRYCDIGVNGASAYCQIVAGELGMKYEDVVYRHFKDVGPFDATRPGGSFGTVSMAPILIGASRKLKQEVLEYAVMPRPGGMPPFFPEKTTDQLDIKNSVIFEKADPQNTVPVKAICDMILNSAAPEYRGATHGAEPLFVTQYSPDPPAGEKPLMARQLQFMEVEVDTDTGEVDIKNIVLVNDVGQAVSPEGVNAQQYGGVVMGLQKSHFGEKVYCPQTGVVLNLNHIFYATPTCLECPDIDCHILENHLGFAPYGMYGCSEALGANPVTLSSMAIYNATGVWVDHHPTTPEKVLKALGKG